MIYLRCGAVWEDLVSRDATNLAVTVSGVAILAVVVGVIWFGIGAAEAPPAASGAPIRAAQVDAGIRVHISGAVVAPGVVELPSDSIVADAVGAAGGATHDADLTSINLAAALRAGERIVILTVGVSGELMGARAETGIDLNTASASELESLPGVGPVLAERIVAYRTDRGPFRTVEDLLDVPGIGEAKLALMRDAISRP
ncbi:MAG: ComEA family DNA-binding protein [Actinomycetota bacterium]|nr:ComEA family DNA-binding protein [Actinomycetota bacterium]MDK1016388.1 ComEA family DNA-binding protein [Actinomycetota bacterium]MDK1026915.1 ComEA family DNA-binding protein [Actinomycetota bacterium]MDK1038104.1 ComEA family DNA-binding protein [Actinomycetota bacterium]MDK1096426.1 ComEA family DNA-binding protein [Actinomycetota bacterium]